MFLHKNLTLQNMLIPDQLLRKWQKSIDLMTRVIDVPHGILITNSQQNAEIRLTSSNPQYTHLKKSIFETSSTRFLKYVQEHRSTLMVFNADEDPNWGGTSECNSGVKAYLGMPIYWPDSEIFATLSIQDWQEKCFSDLHVELLTELKESIESDLLHHLHQSEEWESIQLALIESENKYRELVEEAATIILRWDTNGNITFFNEYAQKFFGFREDEILGKNVIGTIVPEKEFTGRDLTILMKEICKNPSNFEDNENQNIKRNGERVWITWKNRPVFNEKGELTEILSVGIDITERKKTEEALKETEEQQRALLNAIPDRMFLLDQNGKYLLYSIGDEDDLYVPPKEFLGKSVADVLPPSQAKSILTAFKKVLDTGVMQTQEFELPIQGEIRCFEDRLVPCGDNKVLSLVRDITERKSIEDEIRLAATVFENTDEGIIITNPQMEIIAVNRSFTDISGYSAEEVIGQTPRVQSSGKHTKEFYKDLWAAMEKNGNWRGEIWNRRKNGEIYPAWEIITAVHDEQGEIIRYVSVFSDISSIKESENRLSHLAHHDALTGLPNRLLFMSNLEQALAHAKRKHTQIALLFMDLDHFKIINDTLGHSNGDRLLREITKRLKTCLRAEDTVARVGGDEFVMILPEINQAQDAEIVVQKILSKIAEPIQIDIQQITTSTSIGISLYPDDADNSESLVKAADTAMYLAKERGRGTYAFYTSDLTDKDFAHLEVEHGLREAMSNNQLVLHYQPQVCLKSNKIVAVEALLRWQHPEQGLLEPDKFIPVAEATGLIHSLGEWVLRTACEEVCSWPIKDKIQRLAVNISGCQLVNRQGLPSVWKLAEELANNHAMPDLDLELTESALLTAEHSLEGIERLKKAGVSISIDDFGTGYSSLTRLKELPIDTLKIDRSFVAGIPDEDNDNALVSATIVMAHRLGIKVIAEGVENKAQLEFLREENCDEIQGYIFSEPLPAAQIQKLIESGKALE